MTEGVASAAPLSPLMQSWLDDVSGLLAQVNKLSEALEQRKNFVAPEVVRDLNLTIDKLRDEITKKDHEIAGQKTAERILLDSVTALQQENREIVAENDKVAEALHTANEKRREAVRLLRETKEECDRTLAEQASDFEERDRQRDARVAEAKDAARQLRLELAKEKVEGIIRAKEQLNKEHKLDIAQNHQIGKNKGIAIATAYIDAAKEEKADLERSSHLASSVVIQSAQRIESGLVIHEASLVAEGGGNGGLPGTQKEITMREDQSDEGEENKSRALLGFSRKMR
jgi:chromosome segregation ATPase